MSRTTLRLVERHKDLHAEVRLTRCETSVPSINPTVSITFDATMGLMPRTL